MWACCADSSSDDDDHNTSNTLLLLFADAFVAPGLLADLSEVDELTVALSCRFALDILTIARPASTSLDATSGSEARPRLGFQATARVDVRLCRLPHLAFGSFAGSPQPERSWLTRRERRLCCAPERVRRDLRC